MTLKEENIPAWELDDETANVDMNSAMNEILEEAAGSTDQAAPLEAELAAAKAETDEWRDRFLRKAAEFENYRKRIEKEKSELRISSQSAILQDILPALDGFDRALKYFSETDGVAGSAERYREGIELLCRQVLDALTRTGLTPIVAEGKPFDPHLHEALSRVVTMEAADGIIVSELRRGYMFKDSLLRPSQVIVAVQPGEPPNN